VHRRMRALSLLVAGLAVAGLGGCASEPTGRERYVVARTTSGRVVARVPLPPRGEFALSYMHSIYEAPGIERFAARAIGSRSSGYRRRAPRSSTTTGSRDDAPSKTDGGGSAPRSARATKSYRS
jgi:hypothetical protein